MAMTRESGAADRNTDESGSELRRRLATACGHLEGVDGMIADGRSCADVLHQLSAVAGSVAALRRGVAERHIRHCLIEQLERGETEGAVAGIVDLLVGGPRPSQDAESSCAPMPAGD